MSCWISGFGSPMVILAVDQDKSSADVPCPPGSPSTCPWGTALPRAALPRAVFLLPRAQRLLWPSCLAEHWPRVAPARDTALVPNLWSAEHPAPPCWDCWFSGKEPRRLFLRKPHYSIMFMGSKSTTHYLQHEIRAH